MKNFHDYNYSDEELLLKRCEEYKTLKKQKEELSANLLKITKFFERVIKENCEIGGIAFTIEQKEQIQWKKMFEDKFSEAQDNQDLRALYSKKIKKLKIKELK